MVPFVRKRTGESGSPKIEGGKEETRLLGAGMFTSEFKKVCETLKSAVFDYIRGAQKQEKGRESYPK